MPLTRPLTALVFTMGALIATVSAVGAQTELPDTATALSDVDPATLEVVDVPDGFELRVRELPGTDQTILSTIPNGALVRSTGERALVDTTIWFELNLGGTVGWSSGTYLAALDDEIEVEATVDADLPGVTVLDEVEAGTHQVSDVPDGLELNVRVLPGVGQAVITTLPNGAIVSTTGERALVGTTIWLQMDLDGTVGWSSSAYLTTLGLTADAAVEADDDSDDGVLDSDELPGVTVLDAVDATLMEVTDVPDGLELRLRSGPGTDQDILDTMPEGTIVTATGQRALVGSTIWHQIVFNGTTGWSSSVYLTEAEASDAASTATSESTTSVTFLDTVASSIYEVTELPEGANLNVRSAPGVFSARIDELAEGELVTTTGRRALVGATIWLEVELATTTAWVTSAYVTEVSTVAGISDFTEAVPEGRLTVVISEVDDDGDDVVITVGNQLMTIAADARIQDADGALVALAAWATERDDVSADNPLIADITVTDGQIVSLRQTAMI